MANQDQPEVPELTGTGMLSVRVPMQLLADLRAEAEAAGTSLTAVVVDSLTWRSDREAAANAEPPAPAPAEHPAGPVLDVEPHQILVTSGCGATFVHTDFAGRDSKIREQLDPHRRPVDQRPGATMVVTG
jgi:hypothetical protein